MRESVIANFVTLVDDPPQQIGISLAVLSHHKERRRHILLFENIENARRILRIWSIIKSERELAGMIARALDHVTRGDLAIVVSL